MPPRRAHSLALLASIACPLTASAQPTVIGRTSLSPFYAAASTHRVDVVMIGDSNQVYQTEGWDRGVTLALASRFPFYATGLLSAGENNGQAMGVGYGYTAFSTAGSGFEYDTAPPWANNFLQPKGTTNPHNYAYVRAGNIVDPFKNMGLAVFSECPVNVEASLRFHLTYATFSGHEPGSFRPTIRLQDVPFSTLVVGNLIQTHAGPAGVASTSLDIPANPRPALNFRFTPSQGPFVADLDGPFLAYWMRAENRDRPNGVSAHTLYAFPGQSARDMALALQTATNDQLSLYFNLVRALQGPAKRVLLRINSGANDQNEPEPSVGKKKIPQGNSGEAFADNIQAIIDRVTDIWALNAWPTHELFFEIAVTHPISSPDSPFFMAYRDWSESVVLANPRTALVRLERITNYQEMQANNWYASQVDPIHLSIAGYDALAAKELDRLLACPGDFDENGSLDIDDFVAFQAYYAIGSAAADLNDDAELNIDDFVLMQVLYAFGCG